MSRYTPLWLQPGSYAASVDRRLLGALWPAAASSGCQVTPASAMVLNVAPGSVAVPTQNNTGSTLCSSDATEQVTISAAPASGTNRIDLVTCHPRGNDLDGGGNNDFIFDVIVGTVAATPVVPATPAGQVALAQVYVGGGVASIVAGNITDVRPGGLGVGSVTPPALPTGLLGLQTQGTAAQQTNGGIGIFVPITGLSVPVTLAAARRLRIAGFCPFVNNTVVNTSGQLIIQQNGTTMRAAGFAFPIAAFGVRALVDYAVLSLAAGAYTFALGFNIQSGGGSSITTQWAANNPAQLTVEDLGAA